MGWSYTSVSPPCLHRANLTFYLSDPYTASIIVQYLQLRSDVVHIRVQYIVLVKDVLKYIVQYLKYCLVCG